MSSQGVYDFQGRIICSRPGAAYIENSCGPITEPYFSGTADELASSTLLDEKSKKAYAVKTSFS